jgi:hypothetical protein
MPLEPAKRASIVEMVRQGTGRNEVARAVGVSPTTVSRVAKAENISFDRSAVEVATHAASVDAKSRRKALGSRILSDIEEARLRLSRETQARGFQAAAQGLDALTRSYANLAKLDGPDTTPIDEAKSMMGSFMQMAQTISLQRQEGELEQAKADFSRRRAEFEARSGGEYHDGPPDGPRLDSLGQGTVGL